MADDKTRPDPASQEGVPRNDFETLHSFMLVMWEKLKKNAHKGGWSQTELSVLRSRLTEELVELDYAAHALLMDVHVTQASDSDVEASLKKFQRECADAANFCMFMSDRAATMVEELRGKRS